MSNKTIVLDLDGVIADIASSIDAYLEKKNIEDYDYGYWLITDTNDDVAMSVFTDKYFWKNIKPFEDAWYQVNKWFSEGVDVHIVTARRNEVSMSSTEPWLDEWKINTLRPKFSMINEKHKIIKELNPSFVIEDNPHEVKKLISHGINCYLRKAWYNQDFWNVLPTINNLYDLEP